MTLEERELAHKWLDATMDSWEKTQDPNSVLRMTGREMLSYPKTPLPIIANKEWCYRRGFRHGMAEAVALIYKLYRKGFVRPTEIGNIIGNFLMSTIYPWSKSYHQDVKAHGICFGTPVFSHKSWAEIRASVIQRDDGCCLACGTSSNLEVDHIEPVCDGGLPIEENLQTLCQQCHRGPVRKYA
jgi:hypothetical protein